MSPYTTPRLKLKVADLNFLSSVSAAVVNAEAAVYTALKRALSLLEALASLSAVSKNLCDTVSNTAE